MEREKKKGRGKRKLAIILAIVVGFCAALFAFAELSFRSAHKWKQWKPDYEKADIGELLQKTERTDEDYAVLYKQTGLTKIGIDGLLQTTDGIRRILKIQEAYFADYTVGRDNFAPYTCFETLDAQIPNAHLEAGDIVVSDTTHVMGFRLGHAALVLDSYGSTLEAFSIGTKSQIADISAFTTTASFIIVRPKLDKEKREAVATFAKKELLGVPYSFFRGILTKKYPSTLKNTQCAHIVWYAYKKAVGLDLDSDGGGLVTPQDLFNASEVELVQVYGFNPEKLWK